MSAAARWTASVTASALVAAQRQFTLPERPSGPLSAEFIAEADGLAGELALLGLDWRQFFDHALPLGARAGSPRQLVETVLTKLHGPARATSTDPLVRRLTTLIKQFRDEVPGILEELELRSGPLREQWEARGPGLLAMLRRLTEADVVVDEAEVILVRPVTGGGGQAFPPYNAVLFEAVLANPVAELPEIVRLGWLWGQLNLDLPKYQDAIGRDRLRAIGPLALVPATLAAAQEVELARLDAQTIALAIDCWRANKAPDGATAPELLQDWWATYLESNAPWGVALAGLDRLLSAR